ncbi:tRNA (guanosine(18)-2'-O)-methyltransferase TrmH [Psychromonas sp. psych-6C06]|uniref:tRNA (guanosine(18)-2'-O)-methyltransferase TrmH n=1 Tax=Psychromonas sp. psych-6C06 TaxID=2058089 RepID=UPI000C338795|nr:tRNA (guanosine(18)-2'-O)-methyltransferase TrmH [Psychromonas sp. psych-6C06]PKF60864.1 tRNA (guanosine(18)-2'-O)-methyltransferase TrmH [Psychromonas sp. psych-6C06]
MSPERFARITSMLNRRQPELTLLLERVHKPHNLAAIVRTADAVGVSDVHATWEDKAMRLAGNKSATGSQNWVNVHSHDTTAEAIQALRDQGMQIIATNLSESAIDFREVDYTKPTAVLLGQEKHGISKEALALADQDVIIPMVGMCQSLNVSVASALILYEAQRQREQAGMYNGECRLAADESHRILFEGGHPIFTKLCKQKNLPYPPLDEEGQIQASDDWWEAIRSSKK